MDDDQGWRRRRWVVAGRATGAGLGGLALAALLLAAATLTGVRVEDSSPAAAFHLLFAAAGCCLIAAATDLGGAIALWGAAPPGWRWPFRCAGGAFAAAGGLCWGAALTGWEGDEPILMSLGVACFLLALATPWWGWSRRRPR
jgi:hypothetical protein